ncbi:hypothetical protein M3936_20130 [Sutcliffiella horikoshii]|uniref:hypothetical protein n=1 Tax=Sutcliffiella horikoshii TaxID=79883 RepID=UPI00203D5F52|nr:hypothetical protein [Sutcliffiella horikoshii]MCM3619884.1 hypothetical protein [Sutcliffiella horikoshii]
MDHAIWIIILLPLYIVLIWNYRNPEKGMLLGQRWKYKDAPEFSDEALWFNRFASVIAMFFISIVLVSTIFKPIYGILLLVGLFLYILYNILKLRSKVLDEEQ